MEGLLERQHIYIHNQPVFVDSVNVEPYFAKNVITDYYTLSPICVRTKREIDGKIKQYDLSPSEEQFYTQIQQLIIKKYNQYYGKEKYTDEDIQVSSQMRKVKGVRVAIQKGEYVTYNRAYFMDITVTAPPELQDFIYDCGLGEKTAMGFGCIALGRRTKR